MSFKRNSMKYEQIANAELKVDFYAGQTCDQNLQEWHGYFEGDKEGGKIGQEISLGADNFRPGTRIIIQEPVCPTCDVPRSLCESSECSFEWKQWDEEKYA